MEQSLMFSSWIPTLSMARKTQCCSGYSFLQLHNTQTHLCSKNHLINKMAFVLNGLGAHLPFALLSGGCPLHCFQHGHLCTRGTDGKSQHHSRNQVQTTLTQFLKKSTLLTREHTTYLICSQVLVAKCRTQRSL